MTDDPLLILIYSASVLPNPMAHPIQILKTAAALARVDGVRVQVHCVSLEAQPRRILKHYGIAPHPDLTLHPIIPRPLLRLFGLGPHIRPDRNLIYRLAAWRMRGHLRDSAAREPTIVYTRNENLLGILAPAASTADVPCFIELHWLKYVDRFRRHLARAPRGGANPNLGNCRRKLAVLKFAEREALMLADGILCLTGGIKERLADWRLPVPLTRLGSGVEPGPEPPPAAVQWDVCYLGQLYAWKGVDTLVAAMARLPGRRLAIMGGHQQEEIERVRALAERLGVADRVDLLGQVAHPEVPGLLARAGVCVLPAPRRGFVEARRFSSPMKLFEYAAAGRPIVASDLPNLREHLRHGENAWLVAPDDPAALAEGLRTVLADPALAGRLGRAARALACENSYEARAGRILDFIRSVAPAPAAPESAPPPGMDH